MHETNVPEKARSIDQLPCGEYWSARMSKAYIFDMDGVLIDSEPFWREAEIEVFSRVGVHLTDAECALTKGWRIDEAVAYWHGRRPWQGASVREVSEAIVDGVVTRIRESGVSLAGVHNAIEQVRSAGLNLALATSSRLRIVDAVLSKLELQSVFKVVCSAQDDEYGKPHPQVFLRTARLLEVVPTEVVVIEDSIAGMIAAKAARMRCIVVPEPSEYDRPEWGLADEKLRSLEELPLV